MKRSQETPSVQRLQLGEAYSREQLAELIEVAPLTSTREWTGIVEFHNCVFLFVTLDKTGRAEEHAYPDEFDGSLFRWDSQKRHTPSAATIERLTNTHEVVHLFARREEKVRGRTQPFYYCGRLTYVDSFSSQPVHFQWRLAD